MGRGVTAACLAILLCQSLCPGQIPPVENAPQLEAPSPGCSPFGPAGEASVAAPGGMARGPCLLPECQFWFGVEYLMYFLSGSPVTVPLVTSGVTDNFPSGGVGQSGTRVLIGNQRYNTDPYNGIRCRLGMDLLDSGIGVEAVGFELHEQRTSISIPSRDLAPSVLTVPFVNTAVNLESVAFVNLPGNLNGRVDFAIESKLRGLELNLGYAVNSWLVDWGYLGFRHLDLGESLYLSSTFESTTPIITFQGPPVMPVGTIGSISDVFRSSNRFYGGQFGAVKRLIYNNVALEARTSVGFGTTRQKVTIEGTSSINGGDPAPGGLFAQPSNIGSFVRDKFSVIPEVNLSLFVQVFDNVVCNVGYTFLYWNNLTRPGNEIDRVVDLTQAPFGRMFSATAQPPLPTVRFNGSQDLIVHGLNAGISIQF